MTMKSLLLGAAAGIAAIGAAQAADLPMTKGEAVEYVKVCSTFGPGFFYIPGSDTCLKIGGEVRAYYRLFGGDNFSRNDNRSAFNAEGRIWFDARTQTDYGLLRSYFQINAQSHPISAQGRDNVTSSNTFSIDKAFIQFGGLTAGYAHSFFGFYDNDYGDTIYAPYYNEANTVNLLAYTAQFGGGFSATLSIEDGRDHRVNGTVITGTAAAQGGQQVPDAVGQLRYDADWGAVAVQAAGHQFRTAESVGAHSNKYGWAAGGSLAIKIPAIDSGHFVVEGQYADGALDYLGAGNTWIAQSDYFVSHGGAGPLDGGKGWSITAELGGNITPVLNANLVGSYIDTKYDGIFSSGSDGQIKEFTVAGNLTYTIVKGLKVSAEVAYTHGTVDGATIVSGPFADQDKYSTWQSGIRILRSF
ncbi:porin [Labrys okinawensis]|uniref:porin n=1 Tax=Labrys okinawensis TaxID=346911 RepID=UPI0039BC49B0